MEPSAERRKREVYRIPRIVYRASHAMHDGHAHMLVLQVLPFTAMTS